MTKTSFRKVVLCHTNDFPQHKNDKIKGWVECHGGTFSRDLSSDVTHLVCSKQAWKKLPPIVQQARRQRVKVVNLDWLEDSLLSPTRKPKAEKLYEWDYISRVKKTKEINLKEKRQQDIREALLKHKAERTQFEKDTEQKGYHIYADPTGFTYSLTLVRTDIAKNLNETHRLKVRYASSFTSAPAPHPCPLPMWYYPSPHPLSATPCVQFTLPKALRYRESKSLRVPIANHYAQTLQIYESDAIPHTYCVYTIVTRIGAKGVHPIVPLGSDWHMAFDRFRWFFKLKTGITWESRLVPQQQQRCCDRKRPAEPVLRRQSIIEDGAGDGEVEKVCEHFVYRAPGTGSKGLVMTTPSAERVQEAVMVVMPSVEVGEDVLDCQARTPEGGW